MFKLCIASNILILKKGGGYTLCTTIYCNAVKPVLCDLPTKHCNRVTLDRLLQSSKWKFEFTGANQILEHILYTVELRSLELEGTVKICSSYRKFEPPRSRNFRQKKILFWPGTVSLPIYDNWCTVKLAFLVKNHLSSSSSSLITRTHIQV